MLDMRVVNPDNEGLLQSFPLSGLTDVAPRPYRITIRLSTCF